MSESKITPWPWRRGGCVVYGGDGGFVADLVTRGQRPADETEANARLIAAAPNLLEACRKLLGIVAIQNGNLHDDINAIQDEAIAAIKKAIA